LEIETTDAEKREESPVSAAHPKPKKIKK